MKEISSMNQTSLPLWMHLERGFAQRGKDSPVTVVLNQPLDRAREAVYLKLRDSAIAAPEDGPFGRRIGQVSVQEIRQTLNCSDEGVTAALTHLTSCMIEARQENSFLRIAIMDEPRISRDGLTVRATFEPSALALWSSLARGPTQA